MSCMITVNCGSLTILMVSHHGMIRNFEYNSLRAGVFKRLRDLANSGSIPLTTWDFQALQDSSSILEAREYSKCGLTNLQQCSMRAAGPSTEPWNQ